MYMSNESGFRQNLEVKTSVMTEGEVEIFIENNIEKIESNSSKLIFNKVKEISVCFSSCTLTPYSVYILEGDIYYSINISENPKEYMKTIELFLAKTNIMLEKVELNLNI